MTYINEVLTERFKYNIDSYEKFEKEIMEQHPTKDVLEMIINKIDIKVKEIKLSRKSEYITLKKLLFKDMKWYQKLKKIKLKGYDADKRRTTYYIDNINDLGFKYRHTYGYSDGYSRLYEISEASYNCLIKTISKKIERNKYVSENLDRITLIKEIYKIQTELNNIL